MLVRLSRAFSTASGSEMFSTKKFVSSNPYSSKSGFSASVRLAENSFRLPARSKAAILLSPKWSVNLVMTKLRSCWVMPSVVKLPFVPATLVMNFRGSAFTLKQ